MKTLTVILLSVLSTLTFAQETWFNGMQKFESDNIVEPYAMAKTDTGTIQIRCEAPSGRFLLKWNMGHSPITNATSFYMIGTQGPFTFNATNTVNTEGFNDTTKGEQRETFIKMVQQMMRAGDDAELTHTLTGDGMAMAFFPLDGFTKSFIVLKDQCRASKNNSFRIR